MKSGRVVADAKVARGLYVRAVGYDRKVEREVILGGELKPVTSTVHYPPNVQACIFWLRTAAAGRGAIRPAPTDDPSSQIDDLALLDAAGESVRVDRPPKLCRAPAGIQRFVIQRFRARRLWSKYRCHPGAARSIHRRI